MFNSYDKDKFVVGREYYTYYVDVTNRGNTLKNYTGILKVRVTSNDPTPSSPDGYTEFEILESGKLGSTIAHNIHTYMNGYGFACTKFFENKEDCVEEHDKEINKIAKGQTTSDRERILKKLINKISTPKKSGLEVESIEWYNSLSVEQKRFVMWIKNYWDMN